MSRMRLFCFGLGYTAQRLALRLHACGFAIAGTTRDVAAKAAAIGRPDWELFAFDGAGPLADPERALAGTTHLLHSIMPDEHGDPVLRWHAELLDALPRSQLRFIGYLSTTGVYGDHAGAWVDEETPAAPVSPRSRERLEAEQAWTALGRRHGKAVAILRLSGIYGPGQNALVQVRRGSAKRIDKPGQVFNRIHVSDIAQAIDAAFRCDADGIFNVTDDEPTPQGAPVVLAATLLGTAPPPEVPFAAAARTVTPMALSFYRESKRVRNARLKRELGVALRYPTYREGLRALFDNGV
jgi:nucleoside-diphosphate-sugar epimerase